MCFDYRNYNDYYGTDNSIEEKAVIVLLYDYKFIYPKPGRFQFYLFPFHGFIITFSTATKLVPLSQTQINRTKLG